MPVPTETSIRERLEEAERLRLSPFACLSANTLGRARPAEKCALRTEFQRDRDKITHCKAFRRLMHKTQVFIAPEGDHYRTRLTHTLEVTQISRTISRALGLNEDLTEAIALGHDLGHTPFGHAGEDALDAIAPEGFRHNEQSIRVVTVLEHDGEGLNLTAEVLDGIKNHRSACMPQTMEGKVVRLSDKIAYINHDIDDALRAGLIQPADVPADCVALLGRTSGSRIDVFVQDVVCASTGCADVLMSPDIQAAMARLRAFLWDQVYVSPQQMIEREKIQHMLHKLYSHYLSHADDLPADFRQMLDRGVTLPRVVSDYIACMSDRYALYRFHELFMPRAWSVTE